MVYTLSQFKAVLNGLGYRLSQTDIQCDSIKVDQTEVGCTEVNGDNLPDYLTQAALTQAALTQAAIQEFQSQFGLPVTGECDRLTQEKARQLIRNLQHSLNLAIATELPVNEFYGASTMRAVQAFQQQYGLPPTGIASIETRCELNEAAKQRLRRLTGS
jgi:peptidoglycan hydrolase-like protein with peptidoglycan-binding domain